MCRAVKIIMFVCPSIHPCIHPSRNRHRAPIGTTFWNICEGPVKFNCSETDHLRSGEEMIRVWLKTNYAELACRDVESLAALHNSPFGATLALRVLSSNGFPKIPSTKMLKTLRKMFVVRGEIALKLLLSKTNCFKKH